MKLDTKDFRYAGAKPLDLAKVSTTTPHYKSKKQYKEFLQADVAELGAFNRLYYEEVLIVRVHPEILRNEPIPGELEGSAPRWKARYHSIVQFEEHLRRNGTGN